MKTLKTILFAGLMTFLVGCVPKHSTVYHSVFSPKNEVAPYTIVMKKEDIEQATFESDKIIFPEQAPYSPGDVLVSGETNETPNGLLKKVTHLSKDGKTVYIKDATLADVFEEADIKAEISPDSGKGFIITEDGTSEMMHEAHSLNIPLEIKKTSIDLDGNPKTRYDQINVLWGAGFHSNSFLEFKIRKHKLQNFSFTNESSLEYFLEIQALNNLKDINIQKQVAEYHLPTLNLLIPSTPPIPVIIKPGIKIFLNVRGHISPLETSVQQESELKTKIIYANGKWTPSSRLAQKFDFSPPNFPKDSDIEVSIAPELTLLLYGLAGPNIQIEGALELKTQEKDWNLYGRISSEVGIDASVIDERLQYSKELFEKLFPLASGKIPIFKDIKIASATEIIPVKTNPPIKPKETERPERTSVPIDSFKQIKRTYHEDAGDENTEIYIAYKNGDTKRLTDNPAKDLWPVLSHNKKKIVFNSNRDDIFAIYIIDSEGGNINKIKEFENAKDMDRILAWSRDDERIITMDIPGWEGYDRQKFKTDIFQKHREYIDIKTGKSSGWLIETYDKRTGILIEIKDNGNQILWQKK